MTMRITISIPDAIGKDLKSIAKEKNKSVSKIAVETLESFLKHEKKLFYGRKIQALASESYDPDKALEDLHEWRKQSDRS